MLPKTSLLTICLSVTWLSPRRSWLLGSEGFVVTGVDVPSADVWWWLLSSPQTITWSHFLPQTSISDPTSCPRRPSPLHTWSQSVSIRNPEKKKVGDVWAELPVEVTAVFRQLAIKQTTSCDHNNKSSCFCSLDMFQVWCWTRRLRQEVDRLRFNMWHQFLSNCPTQGNGLGNLRERSSQLQPSQCPHGPLDSEKRGSGPLESSHVWETPSSADDSWWLNVDEGNSCCWCDSWCSVAQHVAQHVALLLCRLKPNIHPPEFTVKCVFMETNWSITLIFFAGWKPNLQITSN